MGTRIKAVVWIAVFAMLVLSTTRTIGAAVLVDAMGDTNYEPVLDSGETPLEQMMLSADPSIERSGGGPVITGNVDQGQNPALSDQSQFQRFALTPDTSSIELTYVGGEAGFNSLFGVYTYDQALDPFTAPITRVEVFEQHDVAAGDTVSVSIPDGHAFGFYLDADGGNSSKGMFFSENFRNSDNAVAGAWTDHFVMFETEQGLTMAFEDIQWNHHTGLLGDQDYNDFVVSAFNHHAVPAPSSVALMLIGGPMIFSRRRNWRQAAA